jgi:hypothetical protein
VIDGRSTLRHAVKVLGSVLIGALVAPSAVLTAQALGDEPTTLTDSLPATEHHGEPPHTVGGLQQAQLSTGTTPTLLYSGWTADVTTPMAEVLLLNDSLKAMAHHNRIVLDRTALTTAGLALQRIIKDRPPRA